MLTPAELARVVLPRGTTSIVTDPHEIANVLGAKGILLLYKASADLPVNFFFTISSCVPAAPGLDTAGAEITPEQVEPLLDLPRAVGLAEVMNIPAVLKRDAGVMRMIEAARKRGKVVDGHAPRLLGEELRHYAAAGIMSDHESVDGEEAIEKLAAGMHLIIREGSAARNLDSIVKTLVDKRPDLARCMFGTDDITPNDLIHNGHIDHLIRRSMELGLDPLKAVKCATLNAAKYFRQNAELGSVQRHKQADLVVVKSLEKVEVNTVLSRGRVVVRGGRLVTNTRKRRIPSYALKTMNLGARPNARRFMVKAPVENGEVNARIIVAIDGQIITRAETGSVQVKDGFALPRIEEDLQALAVTERHNGTGNVGLGFVRGFQLKRGALASSVAHDSHNVIAVGADPESISTAVNKLSQLGGGLIAVDGNRTLAALRLPLAGLISLERGTAVASKLSTLHGAARKLGSPLREPFMTLSFLALPVIPDLKLTDKGLVDVREFRFVDLFPSQA
jgi:adenine deaminase